ncbi:Fungalysin metallopeptidase-domain-containing protein [Infundibulicybe gibba]|nr:Fungalysin metallopeptidase-domain-containing protein [Infundibulicybe gibba]
MARIVDPLASNKFLMPSKYATHHFHVIAHGRLLEAFHPPTTFKTFRDGIDQPPPFSRFGPTTLEKMAVAITQSQIGINSTNIHFRSGFQMAHVPANIAASTPSLDVQSVIPNAENALNGKFNGRAPTLEYLVQSDGSIALTHVVQIQNDRMGTWFEAFMDAHSGGILSVTDFAAQASYKVVPIWRRDLRDGQATLVDPQDVFSSPKGWHNDGTGDTTFTGLVPFMFPSGSGQAATTLQNGAGLEFNYAYMDTLDPTAGQNIDAARTNAFYVMNMMHDIAYKYGFTEKSFNFQTNNFGKGGAEGDYIIVHVQDNSKSSDAKFLTLPDGQPGICIISLWTPSRKSLRRDGAMDNTVLIHEFTHGITGRLTGGGTTRCLQTFEARGMGEGWSDAMAGYMGSAEADPSGSSFKLPDYVIGRYISKKTAGIRIYPYSISKSYWHSPEGCAQCVTPTEISTATSPIVPPEIGTVWANMLHNVHAALVKVHGFSKNARTDPTTSEGNVVFMRLFIHALSIQPCNPTFVHARDAWIQADRDLYEGVNRCLLWKAFASRGLGLNAAKFVDDSSVPGDCLAVLDAGITHHDHFKGPRQKIFNNTAARGSDWEFEE